VCKTHLLRSPALCGVEIDSAVKEHTSDFSSFFQQFAMNLSKLWPSKDNVQIKQRTVCVGNMGCDIYYITIITDCSRVSIT
jgi:hypothetical protein